MKGSTASSVIAGGLFATGKTPYREQRPLCMAAQRRVMVAARDPPIGLVREKGRDPWPGSPAAR
jgi:hypothetical protein